MFRVAAFHLRWFWACLVIFVVICPAVGLAADAHDEGGGTNLNPLTADPDLAIVTAVIFVILLVVLYKFAWGPITEGLEKREQGIADQIDEAKRVNLDAKKMVVQYEAKLESAAEEVREMLEEARRDAESTKQRIVNEARDAAVTERDQALRDIELAKYQALHELSQSAINKAVDLAGEIVGRELKPEDHSSLIIESLQKLPSRN